MKNSLLNFMVKYISYVIKNSILWNFGHRNQNWLEILFIEFISTARQKYNILWLGETAINASSDSACYTFKFIIHIIKNTFLWTLCLLDTGLKWNFTHTVYIKCKKKTVLSTLRIAITATYASSSSIRYKVWRTKIYS